MINLFSEIKSRNAQNGSKEVMSITTDAGEHRSYSYDEMFKAADEFAAKMTAAGVVSGDRVVIVAENSPEWDIAYVAVMSLGCTAVLVDYSLPTHDIMRLLAVSDARCIFTSPKLAEKIGTTISLTIPVLNIMEKAKPIPGHLAKISPELCPTADGDSDIAFIIYSSGTTKTATGIMHTHEAMLGTTEAAIAFNHLKSDEKMLVVIPNSHIYGVITSMLGPLLLGGSMHFIESMTGENVLRAFDEYKPTVFSCVPRVFEMFQKQIIAKINSKKLTAVMFKLFFPLCTWVRQSTGINLGKIIFGTIHKGFGGHIRVLCAAGAPMPPPTLRFYFGVGMNLFLNYGLTETNVPVIANSYENYTINSCGKPYPNVQLKLMPQEDSKLCEIYIKTPFMMKGYFRDEEATASAFEDGWFKTGDLATADDNGNISIVGRCKDNIVLSTGKKVTPDDIEAGYCELSGVKEFVACGVPAASGSYDEVHAFVVLSDAAKQTLQDIEAAVRKKGAELSQYMKITKLHLVTEIPKTSLQKAKRYLLKALALKEANDENAAAQNEALQKPLNSAATPQEVQSAGQTIKELIQRVLRTDRVLTDSTLIFEELGMDSLACIELDSLIEESFGKSVAQCFHPGVTIEQLTSAAKNDDISEDQSFLKKFPVEKEKFDYMCFKFYSRLAKWVYNVKITGFENLPANGSYIICPNHQTNFDFLWVTMKFGREQFQKLGCLAKKELFNATRISRRLSRVCGMIPIDRGSLNTQAVNLCKQKLEEGWNFLIYPEGTRTKDGKIGAFQKGAAMLSVAENVPIIPVKIKGGFEIFPAGHKLPKLFDFKHMRRCRVEVNFAAPIADYSSDIDTLNQKLYDIVSSM